MTEVESERNLRVVSTARPRAATLPSSLTRFVGRTRELAALDRALAQGARLVTLFGPGGAGKTRLALHFARLQPAGAVRFVDLAGAGSLREVCDRVGAALGVRVSAELGPDARLWAIGAALAVGPPRVLLLDNCERVASAMATAVDAWCAAAPDTCILATSRELLRASGEYALEVAPFPPPGREDADNEGVALFVDRASLARSGYSPSPSEASAIAAIVRALDGLPLAIELAAARMAVLDASDLLRRLPGDFDLLRASGRHVAARHRSLRDTVAWSWDLLEAPEKIALAQCAVFHGGFAAETAEVVVDLSQLAGAPSVVSVLESLRAQSLLRAFAPPESHGEWRLDLYESVRLFAREQLHASGAAAATRERWRAFFVGLARHACDATSEVHAQDRRLRRETENLLAAHTASLEHEPPRAADALTISLALIPSMRAGGQLARLLPHLDAAIRAEAADDGELLARALLSRAHLRARLGLREGIDGDLARGLSLLKGAGAPGAHLARCTAHAAMLLHERSEFIAAEARYVEALGLCEAIDPIGADRLAYLAARAAHGALLAALDRGDDARSEFDEAERLVGPTEAWRPVIEVHRGHLELALARKAALEGDLEGAHAWKERARARVVVGHAPVDTTDEARFARRLLERALAEPRHELAASADTLIVEANGQWFRAPGSGRVSLARHARVKGVLVALARGRVEAPGAFLPALDLARSAWPSERIIARSGVGRVREAIWLLRKVGLRGLLESSAGGYALAPRVALVIAPSGAPSELALSDATPRPRAIARG